MAIKDTTNEELAAREAEIAQKSERLMALAPRYTKAWLAACTFYALGAIILGKTDWLVPNNFGDYLAGVAAPLAFGWLVVATFLQKYELQMQRVQLRQNGDALRMQAAELKATVDELARQTALMTSANQAQMAERAEKQIGTAMAVLRDHLAAAFPKLRTGFFDRTSSASVHSHTALYLSPEDLNEIRRLGSTSQYYALFSLLENRLRWFGDNFLKLCNTESRVIRQDSYDAALETLHEIQRGGRVYRQATSGALNEQQIAHDATQMSIRMCEGICDDLIAALLKLQSEGRVVPLSFAS